MAEMNCTAVIPTYNRPPHLKRILGYYHQYGRGLKVIVADSGSQENKKLNSEIIGCFPGLSIIHLTQYDSSIDPWHKYLDAFQHVNTKYCLLCADDDFVTPAGIQKSMDFLEQNPDYVSAHGHNAWFSLGYGADCKPEFTFKYYEGQQNAQQEPVQRLLKNASDSNRSLVNGYYAVYRTDFMRTLVGEAARITGSLRFAGAFRQTPDMFFAELLMQLLPALYGKIKCVDVLYYLREDCTPTGVSRIYITLPDLMTDKSFTAKQNEFIGYMASHLERSAAVSPAEARRIARKAIGIFCLRAPPVVVGINTLLRKLKFPPWLDQFIRKVYRVIFSVLYPPVGSGKTRPPEFESELDKARSAVLSSAEEVYGPCKK